MNGWLGALGNRRSYEGSIQQQRQQYRALSAGGSSSKHINALFGSTCSRPSLTEYTAAALGKTTDETDGQGQTSQLTAKAVRTVKS